MADPLCRWHYALPKNVVELVRALPKEEMTRGEFLASLEERLRAGNFSFDFATFQKTAYQLAVQLGLYYIDDVDRYHPRFSVDIDEETAAKYLAVVARCYVAPNPYTNINSFGEGQKPINLFSAIVGYADRLPKGAEFDVSEALKGSFTAVLGNPDAITALMAATPVFSKTGNKTLSFNNASSSMLSKEAYFNLFPWTDGKFKSSPRSEDLFGQLSSALQLFRRGRAEKGLDGWASFDVWAKEARAQFAKADAAMLTEADFDYAGFMRKFVYNPTVANNSFKNHTAAEKAAVGDFISNNRQSPHAVSWYLDPANRPAAAGMGVGVMFNFMMKVRPAEFATYSSMLDKMLVFTGVAKEPSPNEITVESYEANKALQGLVLAKMHELGIGKAADDDSPADYLTVNEFAWWLSDEKNQNLVKEDMMSKQMRKPNDSCVKDSTKSIVDELNDKTDSMMARLTASLLTKPFVILAGASGTGKSRMVKKLAYMTCRADMLRNPHDETPGNYCMIAVKPNWHDSSELLGYKSAFAGHEYVSSDFVKFILKAFAFPNTPFFVCLDEMNLAPVEQYFAEYLSAVESVGNNKADEWVGDSLIQRGEFGGDVLNLAPEYELPGTVRTAINEKGLFIPKNLFVVGTVNMDDTTNQFSRKVLDRAMTIMMNEVDFGTLKDGAYEKLTNALRIKNDEIEKFIDRPSFAGSMLDEDFEELLNGIKAALADSPFEIGYRFAIETALYREALAFLTGKTTSEGEGESAKAERNELSQIAVDHLTLMKVLPRMTGTLSEREAVLKALQTFLGSLGMPQLSAVMLERMKKFAENNGGYISFWP